VVGQRDEDGLEHPDLGRGRPPLGDQPQGQLTEADLAHQVRGQVLAEAVALYRRGVPWWPNKDFEKRVIAPEQEARYEVDPWEEPVAAYLRTKIKVTVGQVAADALGIEKSRQGTIEHRRIIVVLQRLRWERLKKDSRGNRPWASKDSGLE